MNTTIIPRFTFALLAAAMALPAIAASTTSSDSEDALRPATVGVSVDAASSGAAYIDATPGTVFPAANVSPVVYRYYYYPRYTHYYYPYRYYYSHPRYYRRYYSWPYYYTRRYYGDDNGNHVGLRIGGRHSGFSFGIHF